MEMVADLLWQVISSVLPLSWQQRLARVPDVFPQKDMPVLRKSADPNVGGLGVSVLRVHCYKRENEPCTK